MKAGRAVACGIAGDVPGAAGRVVVTIDAVVVHGVPAAVRDLAGIRGAIERALGAALQGTGPGAWRGVATERAAPRPLRLPSDAPAPVAIREIARGIAGVTLEQGGATPSGERR
jgi:hypothetical protein